ncbi:MAG: hypothetical protein ABIY55_06705 [Kofleriaceae bacterium]
MSDRPHHLRGTLAAVLARTWIRWLPWAVLCGAARPALAHSGSASADEMSALLVELLVLVVLGMIVIVALAVVLRGVIRRRRKAAAAAAPLIPTARVIAGRDRPR